MNVRERSHDLPEAHASTYDCICVERQALVDPLPPSDPAHPKWRLSRYIGRSFRQALGVPDGIDRALRRFRGEGDCLPSRCGSSRLCRRRRVSTFNGHPLVLGRRLLCSEVYHVSNPLRLAARPA